MPHHNPSKDEMNPQEHTDVLKELRQLGSPLAGLDRSMPYSVPEGYWDASSAGALVAIQTHELELACGRRMPHEVPEGYFAGLPGSTLAMVQPLAAPQQEVPAGYFEQLPAMLVSRLQQEAEVPEKPLSRTIALNPSRKVLRWAAAAILLAVMGLGIYQGGPDTPDQALQNQLALVNGAQISTYLQESALDLQEAPGSSRAAELASQLSDDEIVNYLQESGLSETELY